MTGDDRACYGAPEVPVLFIILALACTDTKPLQDRIDALEARDQLLEARVTALEDATTPLVVALAEGAAAGDEAANQHLHDHIASEHRPVGVEHAGSDIVWSDAAIIERASAFPAPIRDLLTQDNPDWKAANGSMTRFLDDVSARRAEWRPAVLRRSGAADTGCAIGDATTEATVDCRYVDYLVGRYPSGAFLVKDKLEAVLMIDGDVVRGAIMPLKL